MEKNKRRLGRRASQLAGVSDTLFSSGVDSLSVYVIGKE